MSASLPVDDVGHALIESHFAYKDEWEDSRLFRCDAGHLSLHQSRAGKGAGKGGNCTRSDGGLVCGKSKLPYEPDDEGLTAHQWTKRLLKRNGDRLVEACLDSLRLAKSLKETLVLFEGLEKPKHVIEALAQIAERPEVKKVLL